MKQNISRDILVLPAIVMALLLTACGGGGSSDGEDESYAQSPVLTREGSPASGSSAVSDQDGHIRNRVTATEASSSASTISVRGGDQASSAAPVSGVPWHIGDRATIDEASSSAASVPSHGASQASSSASVPGVPWRTLVPAKIAAASSSSASAISGHGASQASSSASATGVSWQTLTPARISGRPSSSGEGSISGHASSQAASSSSAAGVPWQVLTPARAAASSSSTASSAGSGSRSEAGEGAREDDGNALSVACDAASDANCGAISASQYSGKGTGIWTRHAGASPVALDLRLDGVAGKNVTLIWTNTSQSASSRLTSQADPVAAAPAAAASGPAREASPAPSPAPTGGSTGTTSVTRSWVDPDQTIMTTRRLNQTLSDGRQLNVWVQDSEWGDGQGSGGKVTQAVLDDFVTRFAKKDTGIYDLVTHIAGQPWGPVTYDNMIGEQQDMNIVVGILMRDGKPDPRLLGYFRPANNFRRGAGGSSGISNEALVLFVNAETLERDDPRYQYSALSTAAHELTHMINFYQRTMVIGASFDTWLEETSAMMMQALVNPQISDRYDMVSSSFIANWYGNGINNCSLSAYDSEVSSACFSYAIGGAYGAFLIHQYGLDFYKALLKSHETDSVTALDKAIRATDSAADLGISLARWGASIALLDSSMLPAHYGYPAKPVTVNGMNWTLPAVDETSFARLRNIVSSLPSGLKPHAHAAQTFQPGGSIFTRKVTIPANTTLTVVVN